MEFIKILTLAGPNIWADFPVLEAWIELGDLKDSPSDSMPGFNDRVMGWLPTMIEHRCSIGERGGFFERLRRGTYLAHILEHVTLELQALAGSQLWLWPRGRRRKKDCFAWRCGTRTKRWAGPVWKPAGVYAWRRCTIDRSTSRKKCASCVNWPTT